MGIKIEASGSLLTIKAGSITHNVLMSSITNMIKFETGASVYIGRNALPISNDDYEAALAAWISYLNFDEYDDE